MFPKKPTDPVLFSAVEGSIKREIVRMLRGETLVIAAFSAIAVVAFLLALPLLALLMENHALRQALAAPVLVTIFIVLPVVVFVVVFIVGARSFKRRVQRAMSERGRRDLDETVRWIGEVKASSEPVGYRGSPLVGQDERFAFLITEAKEVVALTYEALLTSGSDTVDSTSKIERYLFVGVALFAVAGERYHPLFDVPFFAGRDEVDQARARGEELVSELGWERAAEDISRFLDKPLRRIAVSYEMSSQSNWGFFTKIEGSGRVVS